MAEINDFELGNLFFGNSRGPYMFPDRDLVNSEEWQRLVQVLQLEDYHCVMGDYYFDYDEMENKPRNNKLVPTAYGGYVCKDINGTIVFEIFPYWWGDCTCGADEANEKIEENLEQSFFTDREREIFNLSNIDCSDNCPGNEWHANNLQKDKKELDSLCTCGARSRNKEIEKLKNSIEEKIDAYYEKLEAELKSHSDDCLLVKHNFVYHPGQESEVWIDWYKYPFRDSHTNIELTKEKFKIIIKECILAVEENIKRVSD